MIKRLQFCFSKPESEINVEERLKRNIEGNATIRIGLLK